MSNSKIKWIEAGYDLFADYGPDAIQVQKISKKLGLNKSGFYHYFGDREGYCSELMKYHIEINKQFCYEISFTKNFDPGFLKLVIKYKTAIFFQKQIGSHSNNPIYKEVYDITKKQNEKFIIPLWADFLKIPNNYSLAKELFDIYRDVFFMRLNGTEIDIEEMRNISQTFSRIISIISHHGQTKIP